MANENFGLGFTVSDVALWTEDNLGPQSTIFAGDIVLLENLGPQSTIFADVALLENAGPQATISSDGICERPSILSADINPANVNVLAGPGQSTMEC